MDNRDDLILEFIDGTLDPAREQELFALMAAHPEMRTALRQHVTIGEAVRADRVAYVPPAALELQLFRTLGLGATTAAATLPWYRSGIAGSLAGAVLGVVATLFLIGPPADRTTGSRSAIEPLIATSGTGSAIVAAIPEPPREIDVIASSGTAPAVTSTPVAAAPARVREVIRYVDRTRPARTITARPDQTVTPTVVEPPTLAATAPKPQSIVPSTAVSMESDRPAPPPAAMAVAILPDENLDRNNRTLFTAELRRNFGGDMTTMSASDVRPSVFEDMAGGVYYHLTDSLAFGVEGGYERYAQVLRPNFSDTLMIEQRPAYTWGGATLRYTPGVIPGTPVRALFQGTLGATNAGPLVRGRLGAAVDLGSGIGLNAGFEVGTLFYQYNNETLASGRWGFTSGLEVSLW